MNLSTMGESNGLEKPDVNLILTLASNNSVDVSLVYCLTIFIELYIIAGNTILNFNFFVLLQ